MKDKEHQTSWISEGAREGSWLADLPVVLSVQIIYKQLRDLFHSYSLCTEAFFFIPHSGFTFHGNFEIICKIFLSQKKKKKDCIFYRSIYVIVFLFIFFFIIMPVCVIWLFLMNLKSFGQLYNQFNLI